MADFDAWWAAYPRKIGKGAARKAYARALKKVNEDGLFHALCNHVAYWESEETPLQYIPHPTTWLNQERWDDTLLTTRQSAMTAEELAASILKDMREANEPRTLLLFEEQSGEGSDTGHH